jgi:hypothetical protein
MSEPIGYADCLIVTVDAMVRDSLIAKLQLEENTSFWEDRRYHFWLGQGDSSLHIGGRAIVDAESLPVYSQPREQDREVPFLSPGERLKLLAISPETGTDRWWRVRVEPEIEGWVNGRFLKPAVNLKQVLFDLSTTERPDIRERLGVAMEAWQPASVLVAGWVGNYQRVIHEFSNDVFVSEQLELTPGALLHNQEFSQERSSPVVIAAAPSLLERVKRAERRNWHRRITAGRPETERPKVRVGTIVSVEGGESGTGVSSNIIAYERQMATILVEIERHNLQAMYVGMIDPRSEFVNQSDESIATYQAEVLTTFISALLSDETATLRPLADYNAEQSGEEDWLGVTPHVRALATLMASRAVTPPLSIGLFGEWGSGKSFFMGRLVEEIKDISTDAHESDQLQKNISFYKYIAQIRFNVWHYVDANLWISLVEHIFNQLQVDVVDDDQAAEALRKQLLAELSSQTELEEKASQQIQAVNREIQSAESDIEKANTAYVSAEHYMQKLTARNVLAMAVGSPSVRKEIGRLQEVRSELGLGQLQGNAESLAAGVDETRAVIDRGFKLFTPCCGRPTARTARSGC